MKCISHAFQSILYSNQLCCLQLNNVYIHIICLTFFLPSAARDKALFRDVLQMKKLHLKLERV